MPETRYRIVFGEHGDLRFIGHLDLQRAWERTFRRAAIQLVYSAGFKPRPRINIGLALPLGCTSQADLLDAWLTDELEPAELVRRLQTAAPPGLMVEEAKQIDGQQPKLQKLIQSAEFEVPLRPEDTAGLEPRVAQLLTMPQLMRERRGKGYDLRPLIEALELRPDTRIWMRLVARSGAVGRADEVLQALDLNPDQYIPHRTRLVLSEGSG